jgi:hypothetical protein
MTTTFYIQLNKSHLPIMGSKVFTARRNRKDLLDISYAVDCYRNNIELPHDPGKERYFVQMDSVSKYARPMSESLQIGTVKPGRNWADISGLVHANDVANPPANMKAFNLKNFAGQVVTQFPVGVFNYIGSYIGAANNKAEYASIWNADATNKTKAFIIPDQTVSGFKAILKDPTFTGISGLNFILATFNANNLTLNLDDNSVVVTGGTQYNSNSFSSVPGTTNLMFNFMAPYYWSVKDAFTYRNVLIPGYIAGAPCYIFHNNIDTVLAHVYTNPVRSVSGLLPTGLKYMFMRGINNPSYKDSITNWSYLKELLWLVIDNFGGVGSGYTLKNSDVPAIYSQKLKGLWLGEFIGGEDVSKLTWLNKTNLPVLSDLLITNASNSEPFPAYDANFWSNLPKVTNLLHIYHPVTVKSAVADSIINQLAVNLASVTPVGDVKKIRLEKFVSRTSASDAAVASLTAKGWTIEIV